MAGPGIRFAPPGEGGVWFGVSVRGFSITKRTYNRHSSAGWNPVHRAQGFDGLALMGFTMACELGSSLRWNDALWRLVGGACLPRQEAAARPPWFQSRLIHPSARRVMITEISRSLTLSAPTQIFRPHPARRAGRASAPPGRRCGHDSR